MATATKPFLATTELAAPMVIPALVAADCKLIVLSFVGLPCASNVNTSTLLSCALTTYKRSVVLS